LVFSGQDGAAAALAPPAGARAGFARRSRSLRRSPASRAGRILATWCRKPGNAGAASEAVAPVRRTVLSTSADTPRTLETITTCPSWDHGRRFDQARTAHRRFGEGLDFLNSILPEHNAKEEHILHPTTDRLLSAAERANVTARMLGD
jgi:hypothetical protein